VGALWGRRYATEAAGAALRHAFATFSFARVASVLHPDNAASIRVAEKLGEHPLATVPWPETGLELLVYAVRRTD
jgi:ribosomal-protein-alanine N-acetyltransferase